MGLLGSAEFGVRSAERAPLRGINVVIDELHFTSSLYMYKELEKKGVELRIVKHNKNWAIDPIKLLPEDQHEGFQKDMDAYRSKEYVKWFVNRHDFGPDRLNALVAKARARGAEIGDEEPDTGTLMTLALNGHIQPEDLK